MGVATKIEWADHTFNPWIGCTRVSAGCDHCYAADMAHRRRWARFEHGAPRHRTSAAYWREPLKWNRAAQANGARETVFPSLCDPFDLEVSNVWRDDLCEVIVATPALDWLLLTKRPKVMGEYFSKAGSVPRNVMLGTSIENQAMANLRTPELLRIDHDSFFVSIEPMLGPIDLTQLDCGGWPFDALRGITQNTISDHYRFTPLSWVIAGGESGPKARASHPDWFLALLVQCQATGVPFFFKQWGEWAPSTPEAAIGNPHSGWRALRGHGGGPPRKEELYPEAGAAFVARVGKAAAGARLLGREWREFPA